MFHDPLFRCGQRSLAERFHRDLLVARENDLRDFKDLFEVDLSGSEDLCNLVLRARRHLAELLKVDFPGFDHAENFLLGTRFRKRQIDLGN